MVMMNPSEAATLLAHASAFDNRRPNTAADQAWAAALHDIPLDHDTLAAVARFYGTPETHSPGAKWIQPHHIRTHRAAIRADRFGPPGPGLTSPIPPPHDPDDVPGYLRALRAQESRIAAGHEQVSAIEAGDTGGYDDNPHVQRIIADFKAEQDAAARRKAEQDAAERDGLRAYRDAVQVLFELPDHGEAALAAARGHLLGADQDAAGFPDLAATPGVLDAHKIAVHAARTVAGDAT